MTRFSIITLLATGALSAGASAALAATAHNSQAGAYGPNTHACEATPYFSAGGCFSAAVQDDRRYPFFVPPSEPREGRGLTLPDD